MLLDAIEAVGTIDDNGDLVIDRAALHDYIRSYDKDGLTGPLNCDGTGECAIAQIGFYQVVDGQYVQLDENGQPMAAPTMEATAEPMEATAEPMEATAEPMEATAEPMEATAEPGS